MTAQFHRRPARAAALAAAAAATALGVLVVAAPASAHDQLVSSDPAADSSVEVLPDELTLVFSGELIDAGDGTAVEVLSPAGDDVADGEAEVSGTNVTVPLADGAAGDYEVTWRVVSSDGHPIDGVFGFAVTTGDEGADGAAEQTQEDRSEDGAAEQTDESAESTEEAAPADDPREGTPADGNSFLQNVPWIVIGVIVVAGGGAVLALVVGRARRLDDADGASRASSARREAATGTIRTDGGSSPTGEDASAAGDDAHDASPEDDHRS